MRQPSTARRLARVGLPPESEVAVRQCGWPVPLDRGDQPERREPASCPEPVPKRLAENRPRAPLAIALPGYSIDRLAAAIAGAGYVVAIWEYRRWPDEVCLKGLRLPQRRSRRAARDLAELIAQARPLPTEQLPAFRQALATRSPVLEPCPRRGWLAAVPPWARPALKAALASVPAQASAVLPLDRRDGRRALLQVAGRTLTPLDLQLLALLTAQPPRDARASLPPRGADLPARVSLRAQLEQLAQPLTALVARFEVLREQAQTNEPVDLDRQLEALRASAERLASAAESISRRAGHAGATFSAGRPNPLPAARAAARR